MKNKTIPAAGLRTRPAVLIFDLGGVLVRLDHEAHFREWEALGVSRSKLQGFRDGQTNQDWNSGRMGEEEFICRLQRELEPASPDPLRLKMAWNSLLGAEQSSMLRHVANASGPRALLSNTDPWHWDCITERNCLPHFDVIGLSFRLGRMKPDTAIFQQLLDLGGWSAQDCLLIDDLPGHLDSAAELGMQTLHHPENQPENEDLRKCLLLPVESLSPCC